jgi:hypothetical protein
MANYEKKWEKKKRKRRKIFGGNDKCLSTKLQKEKFKKKRTQKQELESFFS